MTLLNIIFKFIIFFLKFLYAPLALYRRKMCSKL